MVVMGAMVAASMSCRGQQQRRDQHHEAAQPRHVLWSLGWAQRISAGRGVFDRTADRRPLSDSLRFALPCHCIISCPAAGGPLRTAEAITSTVSHFLSHRPSYQQFIRRWLAFGAQQYRSPSAGILLPKTKVPNPSFPAALRYHFVLPFVPV